MSLLQFELRLFKLLVEARDLLQQLTIGFSQVSDVASGGSISSRLLCMLCCSRLLGLKPPALCLFQLSGEGRDVALQLIIGGCEISDDAGVANVLGLAGCFRGLKLLLQLQ